jgi:hypothetical protein
VHHDPILDICFLSELVLYQDAHIACTVVGFDLGVGYLAGVGLVVAEDCCLCFGYRERVGVLVAECMVDMAGYMVVCCSSEGMGWVVECNGTANLGWFVDSNVGWHGGVGIGSTEGTPLDMAGMVGSMEQYAETVVDPGQVGHGAAFDHSDTVHGIAQH